MRRWEEGEVGPRSRPRWAPAQKVSGRLESSSLSVAGSQPRQFHGQISQQQFVNIPWNIDRAEQGAVGAEQDSERAVGG